ncbi:MAG: adenylate kinase [Acholeplasmataceae bacterium]|jgi:adenylate kinase|nr:adenylate kinase [Acholeplasmataceae bacterium]
MIIILLGAPGAGKGSQAELLVKRYNIPHISTGDIFRDNFKNETPIGKLAKEYIDKGQLVPDSLTNDIVRERLSAKDVSNGFILDGYPRNINQAEALDKILKRFGWEITRVINIATPLDLLVKRISGRRVCSNCGAVYHIENKKTKHEGICDICFNPVVQREDDNEQTVLTRIKIYEEQTKDLIDYYNEKGLLSNVSGITIPQTDKEVVEILGE